MVKIEDVARAAGVSVATVSRVLNEQGGVLPQTQERVRKAVEALHYEPNLSARNLRRNESRIILILAPNFSNPYYSNVLSGICDVSRNLGYSTLIYNTYDSNALDEKLVSSLFQKNRADGMITLAREEGLEVSEERYSLQQWRDDATSGKLVESFACGTAAVVTPVGRVAGHDGEFTIGSGGPGQLTQKLRERLVGIQRGTVADRHGWVVKIS